MFRKAAPAVLLLACGLAVPAAVWAQSSNSGRSSSPLSGFRDFLLGDDQEPTTAREMQRRLRGETRAGERSSADQDDADNQPPQQQQQQQPRSQSQPQIPQQRTDFGGDRKTRPHVTPSTNSSAARQKAANGDAPTGPYEYSGKYADGSSDASTSGSGNSSQRSQSMGSRLEQSMSPKPARDTADSSTTQRSTANSRRNTNQNANNSDNDEARPTTINNPHVAQQRSGPSVMRPSNDSNNDEPTTTTARSSRTVQDRLTAAQVASEELPPVRVPTPSDAGQKTTAPGPSSRRTASTSTATNSTASNSPAPSVSTGPRSPTQLTPTTISRDNLADSATPAAAPRSVARAETITPTPSAAASPNVVKPTPVAPVQQPVAKAPSSRRTAEGPLAGVADSRPAKRPELPADNVLFTKHSPLISVETSGPKTISVGKEATYVVSLQNAGDVAAQDVIVSIRVPEWADVVGAQTTSGATQQANQPGEPYQWRLSRFEAHAQEKLSLRLVPRQSRPFDLNVQYTFSPIASQAIVEVQEPKLTLDLVGPKEVGYGQTKVFRLTLSNPGTGDAENIIIKLLPLGDRKDTGASHQLGTLAAGESKVIEVELTARETGSLSIRAEAVADGGLRAEVSDSVLVRRAGLQLDVEAPKVKYAGTPAGFTVHVSNPGNAMAESVQITATLPAGAKFISATGGGQVTTDQGAVSWNLGSLTAGADATFEVKCLLNSPGENRLQVVSTASDELGATAAGMTRVEALADLKLEIIDPQGPVAVGEEAVYEVHVKNRGTKAAEQIEIVSFFSGGMEPTGAQGGQFEISRGQISFTPVATLAAGNELVLKVKAAADKPGSHVFRTEVVCRSLESKLASEVTTRFYGDESHVPTEAKAPTSVQRTGAITPLPKSEPQQPRPFPTGN